MIIPFHKISQICEDFSDIILDLSELEENNFKVIFIDQSYLTICFSLKLENKFSYHWERRSLDGTIFRHDNAAHLKWKDIPTYPNHFHNGSEDNVESSLLSGNYEKALSEFLILIRNYLAK